MLSSGKLLIVGTSEIAAMAHQYFAHDSLYEPVAFAVDEHFMAEDTFEGLPVVGLSRIDLYPPTEVSIFVAVGDGQLNRIRMALFARMLALGYNLASYVSSKAFVWPNVRIGQNCLILEHNVLQPFVTIGDNVTLWSGNHIGHRSVIEDHVFISSHVVVSGFCTVGSRSFIGVNAAVANGVRIAPDNYIAMSASVHSSTEENSIYRGNPAERHKVSAKRFCRVKE
jgi:sugar O-acyltransferase (sialic acid O-acetyltransferase NeuD family)